MTNYSSDQRIYFFLTSMVEVFRGAFIALANEDEEEENDVVRSGFMLKAALNEGTSNTANAAAVPAGREGRERKN